ncbi:MAG: AraC family transcriptional regulator [Lentisphaerota bacterium]
MNNIAPREMEVRPPSRETAWRLANLSPYIRQSGDNIRVKWFMGERKLLDYLAVYIGSGYGVFSVNRQEFEVAADDLIWIPPDTPHWMRGTSDEMHCIYLHFDLLYDPERSHWNAVMPGGMMDLKKYSVRMHPAVNDPVIQQWQGKIIDDAPPNIKSLFRKICHIHKNFPWQRLSQAGLFMQMLEEILIVTAEHSEQRAPHAATMRQAVAYLQKHLDKELNIDDMAAGFKMSSSYFRKMFKSAYGISPRTMHRELRMWRAGEMLAYSGLNVSEVADRLGFSNVQNFSRAFKDVTSNCPISYRNK